MWHKTKLLKKKKKLSTTFENCLIICVFTKPAVGKLIFNYNSENNNNSHLKCTPNINYYNSTIGIILKNFSTFFSPFHILVKSYVTLILFILCSYIKNRNLKFV